jgi:hypothetical protein
MTPPDADPETEARLAREDLGLPPRIAAALDGRDELRRALATACRLVWSSERWAARQGEELCRALAASEPAARAALLAPLSAGERVELGDGPWLPLALLVRLARETPGEHPWAPRVAEVAIRGTAAAELPALPAAVRTLSIADAPALAAPTPLFLPALRALSVMSSPRIEPWRVEALSGHRGWVRAAGWSHDGALAATGGGDGRVRIWSAASAGGETAAESGWRLVAELEGHARAVAELSFGPRSDRCATASADGTVRIWSEIAGRWRETAALAHPAEATSLAWSPDGTRLATVADDPFVRVWTPSREGWRAEELAGHAGLVQRAAWSPDGTRLATAAGDGTVRLFGDDGARFAELAVIAEHDDWVRAVEWSPDGGRVASGSDDGTAAVVDLRRGAPASRRARAAATTRLEGHSGWVRRIAWCARGECVATVADDGGLRLFEIGGTGGALAPAACFEHGVRATALGASPMGDALATGDDRGCLRVFVLSSGRTESAGDRAAPRLAPVEGTGHDGTIGAIAWHPSGAALLTGSDDRTARVWTPAATGLGPAWRGILLGRG